MALRISSPCDVVGDAVPRVEWFLRHRLTQPLRASIRVRSWRPTLRAKNGAGRTGIADLAIYRVLPAFARSHCEVVRDGYRAQQLRFSRNSRQCSDGARRKSSLGSALFYQRTRV